MREIQQNIDAKLQQTFWLRSAPRPASQSFGGSFLWYSALSLLVVRIGLEFFTLLC